MDEKQAPKMVKVTESLAYINCGPSIDDLINFCDSKRTRCTGAAQKLMTEFNYPYESEDVTRYLDEASYYGQIITKLEDLKSYKEKEELKDVANAETIEQETGEWIFDESDGSTFCSKCTCILWFRYGTWRCNFCPNCGIKMKRGGKIINGSD